MRSLLRLLGSLLRLLWVGVLAFDRIGTRIPQLVQVWLVELFFIMPLAFFIGDVIDRRGGWGVPGTGEPFDPTSWGALAVSLLAGFFVVKNLVRPRVTEGTWTPVSQVDVGSYAVVVPNRQATVSYSYLTSHPSYILLLLLTFPIPLVMVWATQNQGDETFYFRVTGWAGLGLIALIALARLVTWYVLRLGRGEIEASAAAQQMSVRRLGWEVAWKPVLMLMVLIYGFAGATLGTMFWQEHRKIQQLPLVSAADALSGQDGEYRKVEGTIIGEPAFWAPRGTGRGGNNYAGAGVLVHLDAGGEVLLLAESLSVPDLKGVLDDVEPDGRIETHGRVVDEITQDQLDYYGFDARDFEPPDEDGRVLVLHEYP